MEVLRADEIPPLPSLPDDAEAWMCPRSCVTATYNASLGHSVDLTNLAMETSVLRRDHPARVPHAFLGLQLGRGRLGRPVSRRQGSYRFPNQLSLRFSVGNERVHIMLFNNGAMTLTGLRSHAVAYKALQALVSLPGCCPEHCVHVGPPTGLHGIDQLPAVRVSMYKMVFTLPVNLDIPAFASLMPKRTPTQYHVEHEYGMTRTTALKVYLTVPTHYANNPRMAPCTAPTGTCDRSCRTSFGIFRTGRVMVSGRSVDAVEDGFRELTRLITMLYDSIVEPAFDELGLADEPYRLRSPREDTPWCLDTTSSSSSSPNE